MKEGLSLEGKNKSQIKSAPTNSPSIYQGTTFAFKSGEHGAKLFKKEEPGSLYPRLANPPIELLAHKLAILEGAESGLVFSSGSAGIFGVALALVVVADLAQALSKI